MIVLFYKEKVEHYSFMIWIKEGREEVRKGWRGRVTEDRKLKDAGMAKFSTSVLFKLNMADAMVCSLIDTPISLFHVSHTTKDGL